MIRETLTEREWKSEKHHNTHRKLSTDIQFIFPVQSARHAHWSQFIAIACVCVLAFPVLDVTAKAIDIWIPGKMPTIPWNLFYLLSILCLCVFVFFFASNFALIHRNRFITGVTEWQFYFRILWILSLLPSDFPFVYRYKRIYLLISPFKLCASDWNWKTLPFISIVCCLALVFTLFNFFGFSILVSLVFILVDRPLSLFRNFRFVFAFFLVFLCAIHSILRHWLTLSILNVGRTIFRSAIIIVAFQPTNSNKQLNMSDWIIFNCSLFVRQIR